MALLEELSPTFSGTFVWSVGHARLKVIEDTYLVRIVLPKASCCAQTSPSSLLVCKVCRCALWPKAVCRR